MDKKTFETVVNSEEFTNLINEAAPLKVKIRTDLAKDMREDCNDFLKEVANAEPSIKRIMSKSRKEMDETDKENLKKWQKSQKRKFKTITKMLAPKPNTDPLKSIVEKLTEMAQFARYIGYTELEDRLSKFGITLDVRNLEDENDYFSNEEVRSVIKDIFSQAKDIQSAIHENNGQIKDRIYSELDDSVKFSKDNPSGIKSSQFSKLVNTKATALLTTEEKYTKFKENLLKKDTADIQSRELVLEKSKTI